jgi:hypothetical protein
MHEPIHESCKPTANTAIPAGMPPVATMVSTAHMSLSVTPFHTRPAGSILFASGSARTPRPLSSFRLHKAISIDLVDPNRLSGLPNPLTGLLSMSQNSSSIPGGGFTSSLQHAAHLFRDAEAKRCGCGVADIAWFNQTHLEVSEEDVASSSMSLDGRKACSECLSFSTTLCSGSCAASLGLEYIFTSVQNAMHVRAIDILAGTSPGVARHIVKASVCLHHGCNVSHVAMCCIRRHPSEPAARAWKELVLLAFPSSSYCHE